MNKKLLSLAIALALHGASVAVFAQSPQPTGAAPTPPPATPAPPPPAGSELVNQPVGTNPPTGTNPPVGTNPPTGTNPPNGTNPPTGTNPPVGTNPPNGTNPPVGTNPPMNTNPVRPTTPDQFRQLPPNQAGQIQPDQIANLPPEAFQGVQPGQFGHMHGQAIQNLGKEQLQQVPANTIQKMGEDDRSKILGNLKPDNREEAQRFMPPGWQLGTDNSIQRPPFAKIDMPSLPKPAHEKLHLPELPDMAKGFGLGGATGNNGRSAQDGMNQVLNTFGFQAKQETNGQLNIQGPEGLRMAFMPEVDGMKQGPKDATPGVGMAHGRFVVTVAGGQQIPVRPAPKDPQQALDVLPGGGELTLNTQGAGKITMNTPGKGVPQRMGCMFDPFVQNAPAGEKSGVNSDGKGGFRMVYNDGTMQNLRPAINNQEGFHKVGLGVSGVLAITFNDDGTIVVILKGDKPMQAVLKPDFEVKPGQVGQVPGTPLAQGTEGGIGMNADGSFTFVNDSGEQQNFQVEKFDEAPAASLEMIDEAGNTNTSEG